MKDFDVNIMVNIVAGSFEEAVDKLNNVFKSLDDSGCEYKTEIREVGEYLD